MRERLVTGFVGLTVLALVVFGVSRAYAVTGLVEEYEHGGAARSTALVAALLGERTTDDGPVTSQFLGALVEDEEHLEYVTPAGERIVSGPRGEIGDDPGAGGNIEVSRPVAGGGSVTLTRSGDVVNEAVAGQLLPLVLLGLLLAAIAVMLGLVAARRLARPFADLARVADEFGRGRFDVTVPHYAVPEAEDIGSAMRGAAGEVRELVQREQAFAVNASHQLRTPITALRLELEDLSMWPETGPVVAAELTRSLRELDRLNRAVTDLLELARGRRLASTEFDLAALVKDAIGRWDGRVRAVDRTLVFEATTGQVPARLAPGPVGQILDVLIHNALEHGGGTITVRLVVAEHYVRIEVGDQGLRTSDSEIFQRRKGRESSVPQGIGLAVAKDMAEAIGGRLVLEPDDRTTFSLMLPRVGLTAVVSAYDRSGAPAEAGAAPDD